MKAKQMVINFVGFLSSIFPKKNIILFESHSDMCDSSKKLYDKVLELGLNKKYKIVWMVDNLEKLQEKYSNIIFIRRHHKNKKELLKKVYYFIFAKYCFYTHNIIGFPYNKGQIRYFLNHSSFPIKDLRGVYWNYNYNTYIEVTSKHSATYRSIVLGGGIEKMKILGLPRNDNLFVKDDSLKKLKLDNYKKIIIWMPTFRHKKSGKRNDLASDRNTDLLLLNKENLTEINNILSLENSVLIVKFHPEQDMRLCKNFQL